MAYFKDNAITDSGRRLLAEIQAGGGEFDATRLVVGSGNIPAGKTAATMTAVTTPVVSLEISKKEKTPDGKAIFGGYFSNKDVTTAFRFKEFALYARAIYRNESGAITGTGDEVLYSYGNAGDSADLIPAYSTSTVVEKSLDLVSWVGNETQINLEVSSGVYASQEEVRDIRESLTMVVLENYHRNIAEYVNLDAIAIKESNLSTTDLTSNLTSIISAIQNISPLSVARLVVSGKSGTNNLATAIVAKLKSDAGVPVGNYTVTMDLTVSVGGGYATEILVTLTHSLPYMNDTYSAVFHNGYLSKFSRNRSTEYYWDLTPANTGHSSLLSYMASRYAEHSVIFAHVSGFSDLPSGATLGQGVINLTGGILTVVLYTLSGVYYRNTNSTTDWTSEWCLVPEIKNSVMTVNGSINAKNSITNRNARVIAHNNTDHEVDFINYVDSNGYQGIRVKKESSNLSNAINLVRMANGTFSSYPIFHTGNVPEKRFTATISVNWTLHSDGFYYQDIAVSGILAADSPVVDIVTGSDNALNVQYSKKFAKVFRITTDASKIRVWATEAIDVAIPIQLKVVR